MATPLLPSLSLRVGEVAALQFRAALEYAARVDCHYAAPGGFVPRDRVVGLFWPELYSCMWGVTRATKAASTFPRRRRGGLCEMRACPRLCQHASNHPPAVVRSHDTAYHALVPQTGVAT